MNMYFYYANSIYMRNAGLLWLIVNYIKIFTRLSSFYANFVLMDPFRFGK